MDVLNNSLSPYNEYSQCCLARDGLYTIHPAYGREDKAQNGVIYRAFAESGASLTKASIWGNVDASEVKASLPL